MTDDTVTLLREIRDEIRGLRADMRSNRPPTVQRKPLKPEEERALRALLPAIHDVWKVARTFVVGELFAEALRLPPGSPLRNALDSNLGSDPGRVGVLSDAASAVSSRASRCRPARTGATLESAGR